MWALQCQICSDITGFLMLWKPVIISMYQRCCHNKISCKTSYPKRLKHPLLDPFREIMYVSCIAPKLHLPWCWISITEPDLSWFSPFLQKCNKNGICNGYGTRPDCRYAQKTQVFWCSGNRWLSPCINGADMVGLSSKCPVQNVLSFHFLTIPTELCIYFILHLNHTWPEVESP